MAANIFIPSSMLAIDWSLGVSLCGEGHRYWSSIVTIVMIHELRHPKKNIPFQISGTLVFLA